MANDRERATDAYIAYQARNCTCKDGAFPDCSHKTGTVQCRVCGHKHIVMWPVCCEEDTIECVNCGNMTCEPEESE